MNDQNDDAKSYAPMVLAGVVALVIAGVLGLAVSGTLRTKPPVDTTAPMSAAATAVLASADAAEPEGRVCFDTGCDDLTV